MKGTAYGPSTEPRVLHLISSGGFFGAENVLLELAEQTRRAGIVVTIGVFRNSNNPNLELAKIAENLGHDVVVIPCSGRYDKTAISLIRDLVDQRKVNLLHSHNFKSNYYAAKTVSCGNVKWVVTNHGRRAGLRLLLYNALDRRTVRRADCVVAVSNTIASELRTSGVAKERLRIIDNGIDVERFSDRAPDRAVRASLGIADDRRLVAAVGALTREKGHLHLLQAATHVASLFPDVVFLLIGEGRERAALTDLIRQLRLEDKVILAGTRRDVADILPHLSLFVLPSLSEGLPMALLEAMAAAVPVVATSVGGIPSVVHTGRNGILVQPGDSHALAEAICRFLADTDAAADMGMKGAETVREHYSSDMMGAQYLAMYRELLATGRGVKG